MILLYNEYSLLGAQVLKICKLCGRPLKPEKINLKEERAGQIFILEKVPVYICENCDEIWLPDAILDEFKSHIKLRSIKYGRGKR